MIVLSYIRGMLDRMASNTCTINATQCFRAFKFKVMGISVDYATVYAPQVKKEGPTKGTCLVLKPHKCSFDCFALCAKWRG